MPTPDVLASDVMDSAAALLNDVNQQVFNYAAQLPHLRIAIQELREHLALNNASVTTEATSPTIVIPALATSIGFNTVPSLPADMMEIIRVWESYGTTDSWIPMGRADIIPSFLMRPTAHIGTWSFNDNLLQFPPSNGPVSIKIDYLKSLLPNLIDQNTNIGIINSLGFLSYRTAGLCAEFIGENKTRAQELNAHAYMTLERVIGIENKGRQMMPTRRRPFRSSYKNR